MKTLKLIIAGIFLFVSNMSHSQVSIHVNIGTPVVRVPVVQASVDYYYLPDVQAYYDVRATQYVYINNGRWIRSRYLPGSYRNYDLQSCNKVVLNDYRGSRPYDHYNNHKERYYNGNRGDYQKSNRNYSNNYAYNDNRNYENHRKNDNYDDHNDRDRRGNGHRKH